MDSRLILFPQRQPRDAASRERCIELLLRAGGDVRRMIDEPLVSLAHFAAYLARVRGLDREPLPPLVVLVEMAPLEVAVLETRRRLQLAAPVLERASWILFVDLARDPRFQLAAESAGSLDAELGDVPIWTALNGMRFLVLSKLVNDLRRVTASLRLYERGPVEASAIQSHGDEPRDEVHERETIRPPKVTG